MIKENSIKYETQLIALAATQAENGLIFLKNFAVNTSQKVYREWIAKAWAMAEAEQVDQ